MPNGLMCVPRMPYWSWHYPNCSGFGCRHRSDWSGLAFHLEAAHDYSWPQRVRKVWEREDECQVGCGLYIFITIFLDIYTFLEKIYLQIEFPFTVVWQLAYFVTEEPAPQSVLKLNQVWCCDITTGIIEGREGGTEERRDERKNKRK